MSIQNKPTAIQNMQKTLATTVRKQTTRLKDRPISDRVLHQRRYTEDKQAYEKMFGHCYIVKESHIKTTMGYHHRPVKMAEMQHTETKCP